LYKKYIFILIVLSITFTGFSQKMNMTGGSIGLSYTTLPTRPLKDTTGNFGYNGVNISVTMPLFGNRNKLLQQLAKKEKPHFYQTSAHASFESLNANIGWLPQTDIYNASAGIGAMFFNGKKNIIIADASLGVATDKLIWQNGNVDYRFSGMFLVNYMKSSAVAYQYGIVLTYAFGKPLPLPVLGIRTKLAKTWSFSLMLPAMLQFSDKLNKDMGLTFAFRPAGNRFQIQNDHYFNTTSSAVYMQLRQFEFGGNYFYRFAKNFSLNAEAGMLTGGKLKFTEINDTKTILSESAIQAGPRFKISVRYHLPHKRSSGNNIDMDGEMYRIN